MPAIETEGLTKDYLVGFWRPRPYRALDGMTLSVEPGEVFGFLGPNGAGKSTTIKLLMQLIFPTSGTARILGSPVGTVSVRRRIGFLAENPYYYDYLTAEELLTYFARLFGYAPAEAKTRVAGVLDQVGLGSERRMKLRGFSKGMVQRVGVAQAILNDPEVLFLDEPMSGLDPLGRRDVRDLILGLRKRGCTVFFSSHILSDAEALCDRVAIVAQGKLAAAGRLNELLAFELQGWEVVIADVPAPLAAALPGRFGSVTTLSGGRVSFKLPADAEPDRVASSLRADGARLESINPIRHSLEDFFMQHVKGAQPRATGL
ncbi:MAG TPA: ABC transporter ATP-binding protein [Vicinamibacterales bacterium]